MGNPEEIKDQPCSSCGNWYPMDEFTEYDWDYQLCDDCVTKNNAALEEQAKHTNWEDEV